MTYAQSPFKWQPRLANVQEVSIAYSGRTFEVEETLNFLLILKGHMTMTLAAKDTSHLFLLTCIIFIVNNEFS